MRRLVLLAAAAVVALGAVGIVVATSRGDSRPFVVGDELRWIRSFENWLYDANDLLDELRAQPGLDERAEDRIETCGDFESEVRPAPTERLGEVYEQVREACRELGAFGAARDSDAVRADEHWRRADDLLGEADDNLYELLGYTGPLPEAGDGRRRLPRVESRLGRVASAWVGFPVEVRCFPAREWTSVSAERDAWYGDYPGEEPAGFADVDYDIIGIGPACEALSDFDGEWTPDPGSDVGVALAEAIGTLAHETAHVDEPDLGEAEIECLAVQRLAWTARQLGASPAYARRLAETYWRESYSASSDEYVSEECRDGGELDEHPDTTVWP